MSGFNDPDLGVTIPWSTILTGGETGVLKHLADGLADAEAEHTAAGRSLTAAQENVDRAELEIARALAKVRSWRIAYLAAKQAFGP